MKTIGVIGLGVMGASFASRLSHKGYTVYGFERSQETLDIALQKQIIQKGTTEPKTLLKECDLIIIALYPTQILPWIRQYQHACKDKAISWISAVSKAISSNRYKPF